MSGNCVKCGTRRYSLHQDHIVAKCRGGSDTEDNIQYLCANCHEDKTREDLTGLKQSQETRDKKKLAWRNDPNREQRFAKLKAMSQSVEGRERARRIFKGRKQSEDHKAKIASARKKQIFSPEARAKISASKMGNYRGKPALADAFTLETLPSPRKEDS